MNDGHIARSQSDQQFSRPDIEIPAHELSISATHRLIPEWAVLAERALPDGDDGIPSTCGIFNADSPKRNLAGVVSPGLSVQSLARPPYPRGAPPIGAPRRR